MQNNKILFSILIPMYNGANYINNCLHSIINNSTIDANILKHVEIVIVNDGSKDSSLRIAKTLASQYNRKIRKDFITVIDKENGQYGSVINLGIQIVKGKYIKVLDVDDIFNTKYFIEIIHIIAGIKVDVDLLITDFIFDKVINNKQITYRWNKYFEPFKILDASKIDYPSTIITMHSLIYRTQFLRDINYKQLEGVYYSDSQYSTIPFAQVKKLYYINTPLYRYYIGRNDQSINIKTMVKNRLHQRSVMETVIDELFNIDINSPKQKKFVWKVAKNMFEWQSMIISHDTSINDRNKLIYDDLIILINKCKDNEDDEALNIIRRGSLSRVVKITKGHGIVPIIRFGEKLYAKFKLNIMADWE